MASQLVGRGTRRVIAYMPNLRSAVRHFRAFSSYDERFPDGGPEAVTVVTSWADDKLGPFSAPDKRFPMPGMVGPSHSIKPTIEKIEYTPQAEPDILTQPLAEERHLSTLDQAATISKQISHEEKMAGEEYEVSSLDKLECVAIDCPQLMRRDFRDLFPEHNFYTGKMTVITLSQHTDNDMSTWSPSVEEEREHLLEHFIKGATEICDSLREAGYWADFIDPSSGRPYLGPYTNATMFETDERYRHFGFEVEDFGCCKVISHHLWGTHAFVGCLFTTAPVDHPLLLDLNLANLMSKEQGK